MRRVAGIAVLLCLAAAVSVEAQNGPDNDPDGALGYVNTVFHQGQVDSINLYNGQLTVPISLGPSYSVGPRLKVQAMLVYGSRVFDYGHPPAQSPDHTYQPLAGDPALGIGWTFTFGAIKKCPNLCFIAADGSRHIFEYTVPGTNNLDLKTTDASPLYLHTLPSNGGYQMWDGDGNRYDMTWQVSGFDDVIDTQQQTGYTRDFGRGRDGWYARVVADPYGNSFSVDYYDTVIDVATFPSFPCWTYDDINCTSGNYVTHMLCSPVGKTQSWIPKTVHLPGATIDVHVNTDRQVSSIDFPVYASGGAITKATWGFTYLATPVSWECRYLTSSTIEMWRLTTITLPLSLATYAFQYGSTRSGLLTHIDLPTGGDLDYCYSAYTFFHGRISHMEPGCAQQVPDTSDAVLTSTTEFYCGAAAPEPGPEIQGGCQTNPNVTQYLDTQVGVVRRSERTATGGTAAVTHYTQYAFPWGEQGDTTHTTGGSQTVTVVVSPADNDGHLSAKALLFYSGPKNAAAQFYNGDRTGADVQERIFDADPNDGTANMPACGPNATTEAKYCASKAQRVTTRTYDYDTQASEIGNRRLSSETVCYGSLLKATGACSTTTRHKVAYTNTSTCPPPSGTNLCAWDGDNGRHYNQEKHTDGSGASLRTIVTSWTPKQWTGTPPANTAALPSLSSSRVTMEGSYVVDERPEYRSSDGFQLGTLIWDHASPYFAWLHCRYDDGNGSPGNDFTATYSGFTYPLTPPPSTPCQTVYSTWASVLSVSPFGGGDAFGKGRTFQNGLLLTSRWFDSVLTSSGPPIQYSQQALGWYLRNYSRETKTGWITTSADTGGQSTAYQYDVLGRVTSVTPPGETAISVSYDSTTQTTVTRGNQTWEQYIYDGLGRLVREINQTGASTYAVRTHGFDGPGREFFTSEWGNCASPTDCTSTNPLGTTSSNYDPLGRPQAITGPSNATYVATSRTDSSILYSDTKEAVSTCVNGPWSGSACSSGSLVTTTTVKDLFGRVKSVTDPAGGFASYTYDVNDKLRSVSQGAQSRTFTYNAFGYLTQEVTPEKGTVKYFDTADATTRHGSLGNPRILIEGTSPSQVTHAYTYDGAGRLAQDTVGSTQYLLNCYDGNGALGTSLCKDGSANFNGGSASGGKVTRRVGANPQFTPLYPSTTTTEFAEEDFTYAGAGGRVSKKSTLMLGLTGLTIGGASKASESWVYNTLGLVFSHTHPRVGGVSNQFLETFGYTNGRLSSLTVSGTDYDNTTIPGITITPTFRAAGNLGSYTTQQFGAANSLVTIVYQDTSGIPRPRQIQGSVNGLFLFDTGNMTYDAAGNILKMGTDAFSYDTLSRLVSANLGTAQAYTYDGFGNLLSKAGTTFCTTTCTNNKLTNGTYDTRGNLTAFGGETLTYDAENRQSKDLKSSITWQYLFSGADERLARVPGAAGGLSVPRREIARYIVQGKPFTPYTGSCTDGVPFPDVHCSDPDFRYIYAISSQPGQANLTSGCNGGNYCPDIAVTRGEAAVLFIKAKYGSSTNPTCSELFTDAPCSVPSSKYLVKAYQDGVLYSCGTNLICPNSSLLEADAVKGMSVGLWVNYKPIPGGSLYTLRDNENHVVTEFADSLPSRDNVYIGNVVVASYLGKQSGVAGAWRFHSSDHLGTVRLTVDGATVGSGFLEQPKYWPYGELLTPAVAPAQRVGFAAMERDTENNHFYDHARHHDVNLGRFVSPDALGGAEVQPQSWNRYSYVENRPMVYTDPDGLLTTTVTACPPRDHCHEETITVIGDPIKTILAKDFISMLAAAFILSSKGPGASSRFIREQMNEDAAEQFASGNLLSGAIGSTVASQLPTDDVEVALFVLGSSAEKTAMELIPGSLKRSASYASELERETRSSLQKMARSNPKAKGMLKLIKEAKRLLEKLK